MGNLGWVIRMTQEPLPSMITSNLQVGHGPVQAMERWVNSQEVSMRQRCIIATTNLQEFSVSPVSMVVQHLRQVAKSLVLPQPMVVFMEQFQQHLTEPCM